MRMLSATIVLFLLALAGATLEGLWAGMPAVLIQLNGLLLVFTALALAAMGASALRPDRQRGTP